MSRRGVSVHEVFSDQEGGLCPGGSLSWRPPYGNERVVRILLECIPVYTLFNAKLLRNNLLINWIEFVNAARQTA